MLNLVFPEDISRNATGGPTFSTNIITSSSGYEMRNSNWHDPIHEYAIHHAIRNQIQAHKIRALFYITKGSSHSFLYIDPSNNREKTIITGNGTSKSFQLMLSYSFGLLNYSSTANNIIPNSIVVTNLSTSKILPTSDYTIDTKSGLITFKTSFTTKISIEFRFYRIVRFMNDKLDITYDKDTNAYSSRAGIYLIEVKI